jgi:predicted nucleic acid-binding protein
MTVVCNASPLCYLVQIGVAEILPKLYGAILTSETVVAELRHPGAPPVVRAWANRPPDWLQVHPDPVISDPLLSSLDPGERTAIQLAEQVRADLVLLDDLPARTIAGQRGLRRAGTLGVLRDASDTGLLELTKALDTLRRTNFRAAPELFRSLYLPPSE